MAAEPVRHATVFASDTVLQTAEGLSAEFRAGLTLTDALVGCRISVIGALRAEDADIVGGLLELRGLATVGTLGDPDATPTRVRIAAAVGPDPKLHAALRVLAEQRVAITTMRSRIEQLDDDATQFDHAEREEMTLAMFDLPDQQAALDRLERLTVEARQRFGADTDARPSLSIAGMIHRGVTIEFDGPGSTWTCEQDLAGPCVVGIDAHGTVTLCSDQGEVRPAPGGANAGPEATPVPAGAETDDATVYRRPPTP